MKILVLTAYYYPENFRINDLALSLVNKGHKVTVLTSIPNYPDGKYYKGYGLFKKRKETYSGIEIHRSIVIPRGKGKSLNLVLNYLSYIVFASIYILKFRKNKFDAVFVYEPSPITVCIPAIILKKVTGVPICFWVLDLWPESVFASERSKSILLLMILNPIVTFIYKNCDRILVSSNGFIKSIADKGAPIKKIEYLPQWAEEIFKPNCNKNKNNKKLLPPGFNLMFAGNIGSGQDFMSIIKTAKIIKKYEKINIIIIGSGSYLGRLKYEINKHQLEKTIYTLGQFPINKMPDFYSEADVMLITLSDKDIYSLTIPAKLQTYLASAKPILSMVNGETSKIIKEAGAGLTCNAGDYKALATNIITLFNMKKTEIDRMILNSRLFYKNNFSRTLIHSKVIKELKLLIKV